MTRLAQEYFRAYSCSSCLPGEHHQQIKNLMKFQMTAKWQRGGLKCDNKAISRGLARWAQAQQRGAIREWLAVLRCHCHALCSPQCPHTVSSANTEPAGAGTGAVWGDRGSLICVISSATIPKAVADLERDKELAEDCTMLHCSSPLTQRSIPGFISQPASFPESLLQRTLFAAALRGGPQGLLCAVSPKGTFPLVSVVLLDAAVGF